MVLGTGSATFIPSSQKTPDSQDRIHAAFLSQARMSQCWESGVLGLQAKLQEEGGRLTPDACLLPKP